MSGGGSGGDVASGDAVSGWAVNGGTRRPRVVLDGRVVLGQPTGLGRYVCGLLEGIVTCRPYIDLTVLVHDRLPADHPLHATAARAHPPLALHVLPVGVRGAHPAQHWRLAPVLRRLRYDLYHYPHHDLPLCARGRAVVTIHDLKFLRFPELLPSRARALYVRAAMRLATVRARHVLTDSQATARDLEALLGVTPERVTVVPLAAAPMADRTGPEVSPATPLPAGLEPGYLLVVAERRPHKNLEAAIEAYARLRARTTTAPELVIVGHRHAGHDGPERTASMLGVARHVRFLERVGDNDLDALYRHARLFLLPSRYEGFGIPILEAMQRGIPVVTSNVSSMPEVAGDAALLVDPDSTDAIASAMERLLADRALADAMAACGIEQARRFTWKDTARATLAVYERIVGEAIDLADDDDRPGTTTAAWRAAA